MKIRNRTIRARRILEILLGWFHVTLIFLPFYSLVVNIILGRHDDASAYAAAAKGLLLLVPVSLSWAAERYLRSIVLYLAASIGITGLTVLLFGSPFMAVPAVFLCFMRFYNRMTHETHRLLDNASFAALFVFLILPVLVFCIHELDGVYQPMSLLLGAVYFLVCFVQQGIQRIDSYVDVNENMRNMPRQRIIRQTSVLLAAAVLFAAVVGLPSFLMNQDVYRFEVNLNSVGPVAPPEAFDTPETPNMGSNDMDGVQAEPNPILQFLFKLLEYVVLIGMSVFVVVGTVYLVIRISRMFRQSFVDRADLVENLQDDRTESIREHRTKKEKLGFFDRSPNALVRKKYKRTIQRASKERPQSWMTPTQLEENAHLLDEKTAALHGVYEKARYSREGCTREDLQAL